MKKCRGCQVEKPLSEFSRHAQMADGHLNHCKSCKAAYVREHRKLPEVKAARRLERERGTKGLRAAKARWKKTPKGRASLARYKRPESRIAAKNAVQWAVKSGALTRDPCFVCGALAQAHHASYAADMRLAVTWLCGPHHNQLHVEHARFITSLHRG